MKEIIDKMDFIKIKSFFSVKDTIKKMKKQAKDWDKIFANDTSGKGCYPKYTKNP